MPQSHWYLFLKEKWQKKRSTENVKRKMAETIRKLREVLKANLPSLHNKKRAGNLLDSDPLLFLVGDNGFEPLTLCV